MAAAKLTVIHGRRRRSMAMAKQLLKIPCNLSIRLTLGPYIENDGAAAQQRKPHQNRRVAYSAQAGSKAN